MHLGYLIVPSLQMTPVHVIITLLISIFGEGEPFWKIYTIYPAWNFKENIWIPKKNNEGKQLKNKNSTVWKNRAVRHTGLQLCYTALSQQGRA